MYDSENMFGGIALQVLVEDNSETGGTGGNELYRSMIFVDIFEELLEHL